MANSADNITLSANGNVLCSPVSDEDTSRPMMIYLLSSSISNLEGRSSDESVRGNTFSYPSAAGVNNVSDVNKSVRIQKHPVVPAQSANEIRLLEVKSLFISNSLDHLLLAIIIHIVKEDLPKFIQCCSSYPTILNRSNPYKVYAELVQYLVNGPEGLPNFMFVTEQEKYSSDRKGYKEKVGAQEPLDQIPVIVSCSRCKTEKETFYILDLRRETRDPLVTVQQALDSWLQSLRCKRCGNLVEGAILTAHVPVILPVPVKQLEINVVEEMNKFLKISGKWLMFCGAVFYSPEQQHFTAMAKYGDESIYFDIKANPGSGQITRIVKEPESATMRMAYYFLL